MEKEQSLLPNFSQLRILLQILERKWKMDHWWLIKAGKPNRWCYWLAASPLPLTSQKKLGWATGNFELIHYTNMAGKSLMFNRKIASSFVRLYSLSVYVSLPAIGKTGAFPPVLPNRCCLTHRWATPTEVVAQAIVEWWVEAVALEKTLGCLTFHWTLVVS